MTPDVVVDIGNSRIKCGVVENQRIAHSYSMAHDDSGEWKRLFDDYPKIGDQWLVAGVATKQVSRFTNWLSTKSITARHLQNHEVRANRNRFRTTVEAPDVIGIDRLINSYTAITRTPPPNAAVVISVGTAMTVDFIEPEGTHIGGAILPGPSLMVKSLHDGTAALPLIDHFTECTTFPAGRNTLEAIRLGIDSALLGAADLLIRDWATRLPTSVFVTGGHWRLFSGFQFSSPVRSVQLDQWLTLDGLRLLAESLP